MNMRREVSGGAPPTERIPAIKKLGWQEQVKVRKTVKDIHQKIASKQTPVEVHATSFEEAHAILHEAYPGAKRVPGSGPKPDELTARQVDSFRDARREKNGVYYHQDYRINEDGVLYGHEDLPDVHPHKTVKHINVEGWDVKPDSTKEYVDMTIYIDPK